MSEFLNFGEISKHIPFSSLLDVLNIPYTSKNGELHGDGFIVNVEKNLFFCPKNSELKGSVINFYAHQKQVDLRTAASELKKLFLSEAKPPKREIPLLKLEWDNHLNDRGISVEVSKEYEVGLVKQRSIISGRIAFKVNDEAGNLVGYIGYKVEDGSWFYPKGFKRPLYNLSRLTERKMAVVTTDPFDALRLITLGYKPVVSLLGNSMTDVQEYELKKFRFVLLLHKDPANFVTRLSSYVFTKAPVLSKPLKDYSDQELKALIS